MSLKFLYRLIYFCVFVLMIVGTALVLSSSSTYSDVRFDNAYKMFNSHIFKVSLALVALFAGSFADYNWVKKHSKKFIFGCVGLLIITLLFAPEYKGAGRWINLGLFSFQPSELARIFLIIHISALIEAKGDELQNFKTGFTYPLVWILLIAGLIIIQPNVSNALIVVLISFAVLFVAGARYKHIFFTLGSLAALGATIMMLFSHSRHRILTFIESLQKGGEINIQVQQAKIALGSGGLFGVGLGQSRQSDLFLPESYGDFIFSILGEETGFVGSVVILIIYLVLFVSAIIIAKNTKDKFGQLVAFGLSFTMLTSAFVNVAVVTGVFPTTGIPLPFISYGGTSIAFMGLSAGIIINIAMKNYKLIEGKAAVSR